MLIGIENVSDIDMNVLYTLDIIQCFSAPVILYYSSGSLVIEFIRVLLFNLFSFVYTVLFVICS